MLHIILHVRYLTSQTKQRRFTVRAVLAQLATIPFCMTGLALLFASPHALYWLVPGFIFSFVAGVVGAWVLLVEILR